MYRTNVLTTEAQIHGILDELVEFINSFYDDWTMNGFSYLVPGLCYDVCFRQRFYPTGRESAFLQDFYLLADMISEE